MPSVSRLAVNKNPSVEEFLESFILKSDKDLVSSLDRKLPLWLDSHDFMLRTYGDWDENGKGLQIDRQVTVSRHDLAYAMINKSNTTKPIWPVLVRKALEKSAEQYSALNANKLLWGNDNDLFDCNQKNVNLLQPDASYDNQRDKRQYLCMISDRVTRLTNIRLRSTPKLDENNVKKDTGNLPRIVNEAQGGMVVLFDKWSPKYLIKGSKTPEAKPEDEDYLRELKSTEFQAVGLDITKSGRSQEMDYDLQNFMTNNFTYGDIISDDDDRDVHLVYPYRG